MMRRPMSRQQTSCVWFCCLLPARAAGTPITCNRGKTPGTPVQHALALGTRGAEFRHFLASDYGTTWDDTKSARGFAPLTVELHKSLSALHKMLWRRLITGYTATPSSSNAFCCSGVGRVTTVSG